MLVLMRVICVDRHIIKVGLILVLVGLVDLLLLLVGNLVKEVCLGISSWIEVVIAALVL